jgi:hypothetical protein
VAILGGLLVTTTTTVTRTGIAELHLHPPAQEKVITMVHDSAGAAIPALAHNPQTAPAAQQALITASRITTGTAAGFLIIGFGATVALPRVPTLPTTTQTTELDGRRDEPDADPDPADDDHDTADHGRDHPPELSAEPLAGGSPDRHHRTAPCRPAEQDTHRRTTTKGE